MPYDSVLAATLQRASSPVGAERETLSGGATPYFSDAPSSFFPGARRSSADAGRRKIRDLASHVSPVGVGSNLEQEAGFGNRQGCGGNPLRPHPDPLSRRRPTG